MAFLWSTAEVPLTNILNYQLPRTRAGHAWLYHFVITINAHQRSVFVDIWIHVNESRVPWEV